MRQQVLTLYNFDELPDDIQQQVIEDYRKYIDYTYYEHEIYEGFNSIEAFVNAYGITITQASIDAYSPNYVRHDGTPANFRGLKIKSVKRDNMPRGYYIDSILHEEFYDIFQATGDAFHAFTEAVDLAMEAISESCKSYYEDESIRDHLINNEYEFLECGTIHN